MQWLPVMGKVLGNTSLGSNVKLELNQTSLQLSESIFSMLGMSKMRKALGQKAGLCLSMEPSAGNPQLPMPMGCDSCTPA